MIEFPICLPMLHISVIAGQGLAKARNETGTGCLNCHLLAPKELISKKLDQR